MENKTVKPEKFFYYSEETTLSQIEDIANREIPSFMAEVQSTGLEPTSPIQFIYHGFYDGPDSKFTLEIGLAIKNEKTYSGKYKFKELPTFKCSSLIHKGSIENLDKVYEKAMADLSNEGKKYSGECREVYHQWFDKASTENVTEIQLGVE